MFDMSIFNGDGGGTQYSTLEAMDGGAVPVITKEWASYPGPAKDFSIVVDGSEHLIHYFAHRFSYDLLTGMRATNSRFLDTVHHPLNVGQQYKDILGL
jgi:hypothetical protein